MPGQSLGEISVNFVARTRKFSAAINGVTQRLNSLSKAAMNASRVIGSFRGVSGIVGDLGSATKNVSRQTGILQEKVSDWGGITKSVFQQVDKLGEKVGGSFKVVASETKDGVKRSLMAVKGMRKGFDNSFRGTIKSLLSFKEFFGKIIHYITFSIGVQLVMGVSRAFKSMVDSLKEFEKAATDATAISGYLGGAFTAVRNTIMGVSKELSAKTIYSVIDVSRAYYDLASAGYDVSKLTARQLLPILQYAQATQSDLKEATYAVMASLKQFQLDISDATSVVDIFTKAITTSFLTMEKLKEGLKYAGPIAGSLGISLEDTTAALATLVDRGLEGSQAGQRLNMILTKLIKPSDQAKKMLEKLGITLDDINPKTHSLVDILYRLQAAEFDTAAAATMFRARTAASAAILVSSADDVAQFAASLESAQGITANLAEKQMNTLWGRLQLLANSFTILGTEIATALLPVFNTLISGTQGLVAGIRGLVKWFGDVAKTLSPLSPLFKFLTGTLFGLLGAMIAVKIAGFALTLSLGSNTAAVAAATYAYGMMTGVMGENALMAFILTAKMYGLNAALAANPIGIVVMAIAALAGGIIMLLKHFGLLDDVVKAVGGALHWLAEKVIGFLVQKVTEVINGIKAFVNVFTSLITILAKVIPGFQAVVDLLAGIGKSVADFFTNLGLNERKKELKSVSAEAYVYGLAVNQLGVEYDKLIDASNNYSKALEKLSQTQKSANATQEDRLNAAKEATKKYEELQSQLSDFNRAELTVIRTGGALIEAIRAKSEELDKAIGAEAKIIDLERGRSKLDDDLKQKQEDLVDAEERAAEAIAKYGYDSKEAKTALNDLVNAQDEVNRILDQAAQNEEDLASARKDVSDNTKDLNDTEQDLFNMATNVLSLRAELTQSLADESKWKAKLAAYNVLLKDTSKFYAEGLKKLRETTKKLYDAELKRYKLLYEHDDDLKSLVESLFEQGIVTKDVKDGYINLAKSMGQVEKLTGKYVNVFSSLTAEQKEAVQQYLETGEKSEAFNSISEDGQKIIIDYYNALQKAKEAASGLEDSLLPLLQSLYEQGIISSDTLKAFQDYISNAQDLADVNQKIADITGDLAGNTDDYIKLTARLSRALQDERDETLNNVDTANDLINQLGLTGKIAAKDLPKFLGKSGTSLDDLSESEIAAAVMIADLADSMGLLTDEATAQSLATDILGENFADIVSKMGNALSATDTYWQVQQNLADATNNVKDAVNGLIETFRTSTSELLSGIAPNWETFFGMLDDNKSITQEVDMLLNGQDWSEDYMQGIIQDWDDLNEAAGKDLEKMIDIIINKRTKHERKSTGGDSGVTPAAGTAPSFPIETISMVGRPYKSGGEYYVEVRSNKGNKHAVGPWWNEDQANAESINWAKKIGQPWPFAKGGIVGLQRGFLPTSTIGHALRPPLFSGLRPLLPPIGNIKKSADNLLNIIPGIEKSLNLYFIKQILGILGKSKLPLKPVEGLLPNFGRMISGPYMGRGPVPAVIGENGPEAVIPLSGINKKYGRSLLEFILPRYFPDMVGMQTGGIVTNDIPRVVGGRTEEYRIMGPIIIEHVTNVEDFTEQLKYRARAAGVRR